MPQVARGHSSDGTHPVLDLFTPERGVLADAAAVAFQVFDVSNDASVRVTVRPFLAHSPGPRLHGS